MFRFLLILAISTLVMGCGALNPFVGIRLDPSEPCDAIIPSVLLSVPFDDLAQSQEKAGEWIVTNFPTATVQLYLSESNIAGDIGRYSVSVDDNNQFSLYLHRHSRYVYIPLRKVPPTLGHIIRCYGEPEYYLLEDNFLLGPEASGVLFTLGYPNRGIYFTTSSSGIFPTRRYTIDSVIRGSIDITSPRTLDEVIQENVGTRFEGLLKKWPENFTELIAGD